MGAPHSSASRAATAAPAAATTGATARPGDLVQGSHIKLRHLQCLLAVAQHGSLRGAADALAITQPAVSKTIAELEELLDVHLFDRGRHGARPTAQASLFLRHAGASLDALRQGLDLLARGKEAGSGTIAVAALPTAAPSLVPAALHAFREQWPGMAVQIHTGLNSQLLDMLRTGKVELMLGRLSDPEAMSGLTFEHLLAAPLALVTGPRHPLLSRAEPAAAELARFPLVMPPRGTIIRHMADSFLRGHGLDTPVNPCEVLSVSLGRALALGPGDMVWFVPRIAVRADLQQGTLRQLPISMEGTEEPLGLILRNDAEPAPAARALIAALRTTARHAP
ncbi:pca operon transcription factor PcaQ [Candidimonas humi]|uniref:Pca operon transcription factor PcaQ n=1 Tax=Candidimonas humi TaxID=683355 RepID=A0ABV8P0Y5_9BURK|nr:pca operon transcription factor PcaQ [Candidimonas humi]MBV6306501.1 pca operon transcription factor PcaQ [Candidimonas humi]